ncbi:MAG: DUF3078 domain-containing protein, partial [Bacteroidales bacterium]|nr:DUF3078 domain-containing protein [Bacteroidales bacterium]
AAPKPKYWKTWAITTFGFSQTSLTDWSAGGNSVATLNSTMDANANYAKDKISLTNRIRAGYGFTQTFGVGFKKSNDYLNIDNALNYKLKGNLNGSVVYAFVSQFTPGYSSTIGDKNSEVVSRFFAPASMTLGIGGTFKPKDFTLSFTPLTGKVVMVSDPELRVRNGNAIDKFARWELGANLRADAKAKVEGLEINTTFTAFSNYLKNPQNIALSWDLAIKAQLTKFIAFTLNTRAIYDDRVRFKQLKDAEGNVRTDADGKPLLFPALQFMEVSAISFTYTFGTN